MSKKTRKKTAKAASGKTARAQSARSAKRHARAQNRPAKASEAGKKSTTESRRHSRKSIAEGPRTAKSSRSRKAEQRSKVAADREQPKDPPISARRSRQPSAGYSRPRRFAEGAKAPAFRLPRDGGDTVSLADYSGKNSCCSSIRARTRPAAPRRPSTSRGLRAICRKPDRGARRFGRPARRPRRRFGTSTNSSTPLVSDEQHEMLEAYGVWGEKSMYGKTFHGILRTTVLIGADGRIMQDLAQCEGRRPRRRGAGGGRRPI